MGCRSWRSITFWCNKSFSSFENTLGMYKFLSSNQSIDSYLLDELWEIEIYVQNLQTFPLLKIKRGHGLHRRTAARCHVNCDASSALCLVLRFFLFAFFLNPCLFFFCSTNNFLFQYYPSPYFSDTMFFFSSNMSIHCVIYPSFSSPLWSSLISSSYSSNKMYLFLSFGKDICRNISLLDFLNIVV